MILTQVSFTRAHGGRQLYSLKVKMCDNPSWLRVVRGFNIFVGLEVAHVCVYLYVLVFLLNNINRTFIFVSGLDFRPP